MIREAEILYKTQMFWAISFPIFMKIMHSLITTWLIL